MLVEVDHLAPRNKREKRSSGVGLRRDGIGGGADIRGGAEAEGPGRSPRKHLTPETPPSRGQAEGDMKNALRVPPE